MKKNVLFLILFMAFSLCKAQTGNKLGLGIGVNYLFSSKAPLKPVLELNTGLNFGIGKYVYLGPKVSYTLLKEKSFFDIGPNVGVNFWKFSNEHIIKQDDSKYQNIDMFISTFFGFNLDGNTITKQKFNFTNVGVDIGISSIKVLDGKPYLTYGKTLMFQRTNDTNKFNRIGIGGTFNLKE